MDVKYGDPKYLTTKLSIKNLSAQKNVYDFQLRDHFLNTNKLNVLQCSCPNHKHNKEACIIVTEPECPKCSTPTRQLITFQSLLFHEELAQKNLTKCCIHIHEPPCLRCLNCKTGLACIVQEPFECDISTGTFY
jgi:hypothetical protein